MNQEIITILSNRKKITKINDTEYGLNTLLGYEAVTEFSAVIKHLKTKGINPYAIPTLLEIEEQILDGSILTGAILGIVLPITGSDKARAVAWAGDSLVALSFERLALYDDQQWTELSPHFTGERHKPKSKPLFKKTGKEKREEERSKNGNARKHSSSRAKKNASRKLRNKIRRSNSRK